MVNWGRCGIAVTLMWAIEGCLGGGGTAAAADDEFATPDAAIGESAGEATGGGGDNLPACGAGTPPCATDRFDGASCQSLGYGAGELSCDSKTCMLELGGCADAPGGVGGTGG